MKRFYRVVELIAIALMLTGALLSGHNWFFWIAISGMLAMLCILAYGVATDRMWK